VPTDTQLTDLIEPIMSGALDDHLDDLVETINRRRTTIGQQRFAELEEGTRVQVKLPPNGRPRYLDGAYATVMEKRLTKVTVQFDDDIDDPYGKWAGKRCIMPPSMLVPAADE